MSDDAINIWILVALLVFMAWLVPARLNEHSDATFGADVRRGMR